MKTVVIGAGIVGLHCARVLQESGHEVYVLEETTYLAEHTSGRNSGVIHSGVFYKTGSLKERICIEGNSLTYEWARKLKVDHQPCGKWVIPAEEQEEDKLDSFFDRISNLPISKPHRTSKNELIKKEPALRPSEAVFIPSTGIIDAAGYVRALSRYLDEKGVSILLHCKVTGTSSNRLETSRGKIDFDFCINTAGLWSDVVARMAGVEDYEIRPCRGDYYVLSQQPISKPVYHLPSLSASGLGIHLTPTLDGQTLLGPNAFYIRNKDDYRHSSSSQTFEEAVRHYLPGLKEFKLTQGYSGNRPKLYYRGEPTPEFVIEKKRNWIHFLGIESPGLTAAPSLAQEVLKLV